MVILVSYLRILLLLLPLLVTPVQLQQCSRQYNLGSNQFLNITSENYPEAYTPGSNCRYRIVAPPNHVLQLTCQFELYADSCGTEFLFISRDGDLEFRDAERYCRMGLLRRTSNFQSIAFAYHSTSVSTQQRARLSCQVTTQRLPCECGWSFPGRISNGVEAAKHEYPSIVALRDLSSSQRVFCGGNIVSNHFILTAAHCTARQPLASRIMALVGEHDLSVAGESNYEGQYAISRIINHPRYTATSSGEINDIALLQTVKAMEWSRGVAPICLPLRQSEQTFSYVNVDVVGWGTLGFSAPKANRLQKATLLTMENRACQEQYNSSIAASQLCTYDSRGLGQDSCQYDSGGPVIFRQQQRLFLLGIISFGRPCGQPYSIGINTRITAHLNWIWGYVGGEVCVR